MKFNYSRESEYYNKVVEGVIFFFRGIRARSRAASTSKMECFVIIVNGWKRLTIITKRFILDVAAALDPPLSIAICFSNRFSKFSRWRE